MVFSQLADSCGGGEAFRSGARRPSSLAPSGRRLPARTAWALSLRCALPRSRFPDALRPAGPRIFADTRCRPWGPSGLPRVPSDLPRAVEVV